jgi:hypothetical protein
MRGLYGELSESAGEPAPVFKTTAIDHSAIPPREPFYSEFPLIAR